MSLYLFRYSWAIGLDIAKHTKVDMIWVAGGAGGQLTYAPVTTYILEQGPNPHIPLVPSAIQQGEIPSNSLVWSLNREKCFPSPAVDWAVVLHFPFPRPDVGVLY